MQSTSNLSHLGGFITGLFPSFIFLPNLKWEKYEASFPYLGKIALIDLSYHLFSIRLKSLTIVRGLFGVLACTWAFHHSSTRL